MKECALTRGQWERAIRTIEDRLEKGETPEAAARAAYDEIGDEAAMGAMFALCAYALPGKNRRALSWGWADWLRTIRHPEATRAADEMEYYLPPRELEAIRNQRDEESP